MTSLPDVSEFPLLNLNQWIEWFQSAAQTVLLSTPDQGVAIFYQTDLKHEGVWVDKTFLLQQAALLTGHSLLWKKVICRVRPGEVSFGRPAFGSLVCFSRHARADRSRSTADVVPDGGIKAWARGMGVEACRIACQFVLRETKTRTIVAPFCGHGTVLAVAESMGLRSIGIELSRKRVRKAQRLFLDDLILAGSLGRGRRI